MKQNTFYILLFLLFPVFVLQAQAETDAFGIILFAQGQNVSVYRDGTYTDYDPLIDDLIGMPLFENDIVQTSEDTYLEIQLIPTRNLVKIAENTSFEINGLDAGGNSDFQVAYGRIRSKVERLIGSERFTIRSESTVAGVRGTDFGFDFLVLPEFESSEPVSRVYCFEGSLLVTAGERVEELPEGRMLTVRIKEAAEDTGDEYLFETSSIGENISVYWQEYDFEREAVDPDAVWDLFPGLETIITPPAENAEEDAAAEAQTEGGALEEKSSETPPSEELFPEKETGEKGDALRIAGGVLIAGGIAAELGGLFFQFAGSLFPGLGIPNNSDVGIPLMIGGGAFIITGLITFFAGLSGN
jgi:hypothetical protein